MNRGFLHTTGGLLLISLWVQSASAGVLFTHQGATDPTTEGWSAFVTGGSSVGPVINDLGLGIDAWFTDDNSTASPSAAGYQIALSTAQGNEVNTAGWSLKATLRLVDIPDPALGIALQYADGLGTQYTVRLGSDAAGDPIVQLFDGAPITLTGLGSGYHEYNLDFDAVAGEAALFVDGSLVFSGYQGISNTPVNDVYFGTAGSPLTGQANFASVSFRSKMQSVPEPTSLALLSVGACVAGLGAARRRRCGGD